MIFDTFMYTHKSSFLLFIAVFSISTCVNNMVEELKEKMKHEHMIYN